MATSVKYDENRNELIVHGIVLTPEQQKKLSALIKMVVDDFADTVSAGSVKRSIKKRIPTAGTPAGSLKAYRIRAELTQAQLAKKTGIAQGHISAMERGRRIIGVKSAKTFAKALNCRWEKLVG